MGYIFRRQGKQDEALEYINRALTLDPRNLFTLQQVALSYFYLRRFPENVAVLDRAPPSNRMIRKPWSRARLFF